jgi:hypothetical protein
MLVQNILVITVLKKIGATVSKKSLATTITKKSFVPQFQKILATTLLKN